MERKKEREVVRAREREREQRPSSDFQLSHLVVQRVDDMDVCVHVCV